MFGRELVLRAKRFLPAVECFRDSTRVAEYIAEAANITLNGADVSQWSNTVSGSHHLVQATAAKQPLWAASDVAFRDRGSVQFDGTDEILETADDSFNGVLEVNDRPSMLGVLRWPTAGAPAGSKGRAVWWGEANGTVSMYFIHYSDNNIYCDYRYEAGGADATTSKTYTPDTLAHLFELHAYSTGHVAARDGVETVSVNTPGVSSDSTDSLIATPQILSIGGEKAFMDDSAADCAVSELVLLKDATVANVATYRGRRIAPLYGLL